MKLQIKIQSPQGWKTFKSVKKALDYLKPITEFLIWVNGEPHSFIGLREFYNIEMREREHNKRQSIR